jgi:hypothetical protein
MEVEEDDEEEDIDKIKAISTMLKKQKKTVVI